MLSHKGTVTLQTERLVLRRFSSDDADAIFANWANDARVTKYMTWTPHGSVEATKLIIASWCEQYEKNDYYNWCITLNGVPIGSISVVEINDKSEHTGIGYCSGFDYWGNGYMTEAVNAVVKFLFEEVNVNRIEIGHATKNPASGKVARKCGFTLEGVKREFFRSPSSGELLDIAFLSILKSEYKK